MSRSILVTQIILSLCAYVPIMARGQDLYITHSTEHSVSIVVIDTERDLPKAALEVKSRFMTAKKAIEFEAAYPPWVMDPSDESRVAEEKQGRGETVSVDNWPVAIAAGGGSVFGAVGDEDTGFIFQLPQAAAKSPRYFDTLQRHAFSIIVAGNKVFVSYVNKGVWSVDLGSGLLQRVDDRYDSAIDFVDATDGKEQPDAAWREEAHEMRRDGPGIMFNGCTYMAGSQDQKRVYVAGSYQGATPAVYIINVEKNKLVRVLRLSSVTTSGGEGIIGMGRASDGIIYVATYGASHQELKLHWIDGATGKVVRSNDLVIRLAAISGSGRNPTVAVAKGTLFVLSGAGLRAFSLAPPYGNQVIDLTAPPGGVWTTPNGRKIYVTLPSQHQIVPFSIEGARLVRRQPIAIQGEIGAITIGAAVR